MAFAVYLNYIYDEKMYFPNSDCLSVSLNSSDDVQELISNFDSPGELLDKYNRIFLHLYFGDKNKLKKKYLRY